MKLLSALILVLSLSCQGGGPSSESDAGTPQTNEENNVASDESSAATESSSQTPPTADSNSYQTETNDPVDSEQEEEAAEEPVDPSLLAGAPFLVTVDKSEDQVTLNFSEPEQNANTITDYIFEYKEESEADWKVFNDGESTNLEVAVTGLSPSTSYLFRAYSFNGYDGPYSDELAVRTQDDNPFFDSGIFKLMNVGGATNSRMVALEDSTSVTLADGLTTVTIDKGQTYSFTSQRGDIISSDKPVFVAGRLASDFSPTKQANIVWSPPAWAGHHFLVNLERSKPHLLTAFMFSAGTLTITRFNEEPQTYAFTDSEFKLIGISDNGNYTISSDSSALLYVHSKASNSMSYVDPRPVMQASYDIIGFPSTSAKITVDTDNTLVTRYIASGETDSTTGFRDTIIEHQGTGSTSDASSYQFFKGYPSRYVSSGGKIAAMSYGDGDGTCATSYLPVHLQKKRYAVNTSAAFVAFASTNPATITVSGTDDSVSLLQLTRLSDDPNTPYYAKLDHTAEGTIFESDQSFAAWYQTDSDHDAAQDDETLMFGFD